MKQHPGAFVTGLVFVVIGAAFLGDSLGWWDMAMRRLWPVIVIAIGVVMMINASRGSSKDSDT